MLHATDAVVEVDNLGKLYSRDTGNTRRRLATAMRSTLLGQSIRPIGELRKGEFWALKNVNFNLHRGEAIGIIGLNGSGKTTLLRILSGQLLPDEGEVRIRGATAAMIDLTAGFQPSASGRDNIFLRGAMLGRSRADMLRTVDEIIDFTELGDAIEAPVMTYSAGMTMRLAFAIMIAATPDILFIDEVLAVGDFKFRQKCLAKIREMRARASFVLVTHNMHDVKFFCTSAIVLSKGRVVFSGDPAQAVDYYQSLQDSGVDRETVKQASVLGPSYHNKEAIDDVQHFWCNEAGEKVETARTGEKLFFQLSFMPKITSQSLTLGIPVWNEQGINVTGFSTELADIKLQTRAGERARFTLEIPQLHLNPGVYISNLGIVDGVEFYYRFPNAPLAVLSSRTRNFGIFDHPHIWRHIR